VEEVLVELLSDQLPLLLDAVRPTTTHVLPENPAQQRIGGGRQFLQPADHAALRKYPSEVLLYAAQMEVLSEQLDFYVSGFVNGGG
jgi:hypothetical protein